MFIAMINPIKTDVQHTRMLLSHQAWTLRLVYQSSPRAQTSSYWCPYLTCVQIQIPLPHCQMFLFANYEASVWTLALILVAGPMSVFQNFAPFLQKCSDDAYIKGQTGLLSMHVSFAKQEASIKWILAFVCNAQDLTSSRHAWYLQARTDRQDGKF